MRPSRERPREVWTIPAPHFDAMARRAEEDYPEETCGLLFDGGGELEVVPLENIQNALHRADPAAHPRDARTAYAFDTGKLCGAISGRESAGKTLRAIYHSHPDHEAYFSAKDREDAVPPQWGGPTYPGTVYIVFSVYAGKLKEAKGFLWSEDEKDFVELSISRAAP